MTCCSWSRAGRLDEQGPASSGNVIFSLRRLNYRSLCCKIKGTHKLPDPLFHRHDNLLRPPLITRFEPDYFKEALPPVFVPTVVFLLNSIPACAHTHLAGTPVVTTGLTPRPRLLGDRLEGPLSPVQ